MFHRQLLPFFLAFGLGRSTITILDPSDFHDLATDASDNAIVADYNITPVMYQTGPIQGPYYYSDVDKALYHQTFEDGSNDTSVIVITEKSDVNVSYSTIVKHGYASNLFQSSFFGTNAAINVANASTAHLSHLNVTTHNGAANIYAYGTGTFVYVDHTTLYSSGPIAHGLYASGNGTIIGRNIKHYSGGNRASSFAGDNPAGYIYIYDSEAHTTGIGSAIFYALGSIYAENIVGVADNSPAIFSDGIQTINLKDADLTGGLLAGILMFSSAEREAGAAVNLTNSVITSLPTTAPALWFGNIIATADIVSSQLNSTSGVLVVANYSQVTQAFDYYAGYADNSDLLPAEVTLHIKESSLKGDLVAYNGSSISWELSEYSSWTGTAYSGYKKGYLAVSLDKTSNWTLTKDTYLTNFTDSDTTLGNVFSAGHNLYYDKTSSANDWLNRKTIKLNGGGKLIPASHGAIAK